MEPTRPRMNRRRRGCSVSGTSKRWGPARLSRWVSLRQDAGRYSKGTAGAAFLEGFRIAAALRRGNDSVSSVERSTNFDASHRGGGPPWCGLPRLGVVVQTGVRRVFGSWAGSSRPLKRLPGFWVVLVNVRTLFVGCCRPGLAGRTRSRGLGRPVPSRRCSDYPHSRPLEELGRLDGPSTVVTRPMVFPALVVPG